LVLIEWLLNDSMRCGENPSLLVSLSNAKTDYSTTTVPVT
jgi:hypothetical protein